MVSPIELMVVFISLNDVLASSIAISISVPIVSNFAFILSPIFSNVERTPLNMSEFFILSRTPPSPSNISNTDAKGFINLSPNLDMANKTPEISNIDILVPKPPS